MDLLTEKHTPQSMGRAEGKSDLGGNTPEKHRPSQKAGAALTERLQECIKRDQRKLLEITLETHFQWTWLKLVLPEM